MEVRINNISREKQLKEIIKFAKEGRNKNFDIPDIEKYYKDNNIILFDKAKEYFKEYNGIMEIVYLSFEDDENAYYDFNFRLLYPDAYLKLQDVILEEDYGCDDIQEYAGEECIIVGFVGYYYPGILAIGKSGSLYIHHYDYSDEILKFNSMMELLDYEIPKRNILKIRDKQQF